jgi:hypothetical protein
MGEITGPERKKRAVEGTESHRGDRGLLKKQKAVERTEGC